MQVVRGQQCCRPKCRRRSQVRCSSRSVRHHISRFCDICRKFCELEMSDAQCKCIGCCGQRREIYVSRCCRSIFSLESTRHFTMAISGFSDGSYQFLLRTTFCSRTNQSSNNFLQDYLFAPIKCRIRWLYRSGLGTQCPYYIRLN